MPAEYHDITKEEMEDLLVKGWGFRRMDLPGTVELVYGKVAVLQGQKISCRVYTGINPSGHSRAKGEDAIRIQLYCMFDDGDGPKPKPCGTPRKCLRVKTWAANIKKALAGVREDFKVCPACGSPMAERKGANGKFLGCVSYHKTGCKGR